jgi:hypothetical protein
MVRCGNTDDIDAGIVQRSTQISDSTRCGSNLPASHLSHTRVTDSRVDIAHIQYTGISPTGKKPQMRIAASSDTHHGDPKLIQRTAVGRYRITPGFRRRGGSQCGGKHRFLKKLTAVSITGHEATHAFQLSGFGSVVERQWADQRIL